MFLITVIMYNLPIISQDKGLLVIIFLILRSKQQHALINSLWPGAMIYCKWEKFHKLRMINCKINTLVIHTQDTGQR